MKKMSVSSLIEPPNLKRPGVKAAFTTASDAIDRASLAGLFNIPEKSVYLPVQKHTSTVHILTPDLEPVTADAVITHDKEVLIGVLVADCVPILVYDRRKYIIAAVHAGWRGTAQSILTRAIRTMQESYDTDVEDVFMAVGPGIRSCCYDVGSDVRDAVTSTIQGNSGETDKKGKHFLDLPSVNKSQALILGVPEENIWISGECTFCSSNRFHSYRRSGSDAGRQGGFIMMW